MSQTQPDDALFLQASEALLTFEGRPVGISICPLDDGDGMPGTLATLLGVLQLVGRDSETIAVQIGTSVLSMDHRVSRVQWDSSTGDPLVHIVTADTLLIVGPPIEPLDT